MSQSHKAENTRGHKPEESTREKQEREENLDQTIADSFPASDPPSSIPDPDHEHEDDEAA